VNTSEELPFSLSQDGMLYLIRAMDYEIVQQVNVTVVAKDGKFQSDPITLSIEVIGVNDNAPKFTESKVSTTLH